MTIEQRAELKERIIETIAQTKDEVSRLEEITQPIGPENAIGRVSRMDAIHNKSVSEAALRSAKRKLSSLQLALTKVDSPGFGICSRCQQPIPSARLLYMPQSTRCVRCADQ